MSGANDPYIYRNRLMPPTRVTSFSSSTRNRRVCKGAAFRQSHPETACHRGQFRTAGATSASRAGKRPFLIAKQLPSSSDSAIAPQLTATNGCDFCPVAHRGGQNIPDELPGPPAFARPRFPLNQHRRTGAGIQQIVCRTCSICGD